MIIMNCSWKKLDRYVNLFLDNNLKLKGNLKEYNLTPKGIELIKEQGYNVRRPIFWLDIDPKKATGKINDSNKWIEIHPLVDSYERDKTFFHELTHLHYDFLYIALNPKLSFEEYEILTEWLARKHRSNPFLLKSAVNVFELEPHIYDLSSYFAFARDYFLINKEINFPRLEILMD